MKTRFIATVAIIASSFTPATFSAIVSAAAAETVSGNHCKLSANQVAKGWRCEAKKQLIGRESQVKQRLPDEQRNGNVVRFAYCQDRDIYHVTYTATNPGGDVSLGHSFASGKPVAGEWQSQAQYLSPSPSGSPSLCQFPEVGS